MKWTQTALERPEPGTRCIVITESGDERELIYDQNHWFLPDRSMYVYFVPVFWRVKEAE